MKKVSRKKIEKKSDLKSRFFVGSVCILILALLLPNAFNPILANLIALIFAALCAMALWEFLVLCEKKQMQPPKAWIITGSILYVLSTFLSVNLSNLVYVPMLVLSLTIFLIFILHFKNPKNSLNQLGTSIFGLIYIAVPIGFMIHILYQPYILQDGRLWLLYLIILTKGNDIAAYYVGRFFGKRKLASHLSPKKTVLGSFAGITAALIFSLLFYVWLKKPHFWHIQLNLVEAIVLGLLIPIVGQIGDLAESLIKRDVGTKDSSFLPGLGGVLDILDALLFTAPMLYFYLRFQNIL